MVHVIAGLQEVYKITVQTAVNSREMIVQKKIRDHCLDMNDHFDSNDHNSSPTGCNFFRRLERGSCGGHTEKSLCHGYAAVLFEAEPS